MNSSSFYLYKAKRYTSQDSMDFTKYKSLLAHAAETASIASAWIEFSPLLLSSFEFAAENQNPDFLLYNAFIHDAGKLAWKFQRTLLEKPMLESLYPGIAFIESSSCTPYRHDFIDGLDDNRHAASILVIIRKLLKGHSNLRSCEKWIKASMSHHDRRKSEQWLHKNIASLIPVGNGEKSAKEQDIDSLKEFQKIAEILFPGIAYAKSSSKIIGTTEHNTNLKGFIAICDWIASFEGFFPFSITSFKEKSMADSDPVSYMKSIRDESFRILEECGIASKKIISGGWKNIFPDGDITPRGLQKTVIPGKRDNRLFIVEATPGSGKTELALSLASEILASGGADNVIFALPTQVTSNAIYPRVTEKRVSGKSLCDILFPEGGNALLVHGNALHNKQYMEARTDPDFASWLVTGSKRSLLGSFAACTLDQALMSALPVKHGCARSLALSRSVFVVDEAHSYDAYMNTFLDKVLSMMSKAGRSVIVLSATLPRFRRESMLRAWCGAGGATSTAPEIQHINSAIGKIQGNPQLLEGFNAYPSITVAEGARNILKDRELLASPFFFLPSSEKEKSKTYVLHSKRTPDAMLTSEMATSIVKRASEGDVVSCVMNLVDDACDTYRTLFWECRRQNVSLTPDLYHARFLLCDRFLIESRILARYGKHRIPGDGGIVIGTQVLEQSLDLDYDLLYTQLCPVDAMFQRLGREYRHDCLRRFFDRLPECFILSNEGIDFGKHSLIYGFLGEKERNHNISLLWRTRELIEKSGERGAHVQFPEDIRSWIDRVYADAFAGEPRESAEGHRMWLQYQQSESFFADCLGTNMNIQFADTGKTAAKMTRSGMGNLSFLLYAMDGEGHPVTLGGEQFTSLDFSEPEKSERVHVNTVNVPDSSTWQCFGRCESSPFSFSQRNENSVRAVRMYKKGEDGTFEGDFFTSRDGLTYSSIYGLRRSGK